MTAFDAHDPRPTGHDSSRRRRLAGLLLIALTTALIAGCGWLNDLAELGGRIEDAGYEQVEVNHSLSGTDGNAVTIQALTPPSEPTEEDIGTIAEIVWTTYPRAFDVLIIEIDGRQADPISRDQLAEAFGERDPALDQGTGIGQVLLIGLIGIMTVFALIVVLVIVLVRRSRRAAARTAPPPWPQPAGAMYPQAPPTPPATSPWAPAPSSPWAPAPSSPWAPAPSTPAPPPPASPVATPSAPAAPAPLSAPPPSQPQPPSDVQRF